MKPNLLTTLLLGILIASPSAIAQDARSADRDATSSVDDPAFDQLVNFNLVEKAVSSGNPGLLADVAFLFVMAEESLLRTHASGKLSADSFLRAAMEAAAVKEDKETMARLVKQAEKMGEAGKSLAAQIQISKIGKTRKTVPTVPVSASWEEILRRKKKYDAETLPALDHIRMELPMLLAVRGNSWPDEFVGNWEEQKSNHHTKLTLHKNGTFEKSEGNTGEPAVESSGRWSASGRKLTLDGIVYDCEVSGSRLQLFGDGYGYDFQAFW